MAKGIRLYWWSEIHIQKKELENYGDLLGKYLVEKISGRKVSWLRANRFYIKNWWRPVYVTIGSILEHIGSHCIVWGSGMSHRGAQIADATFIAVRGPLSRKRILELGYECPEIYGDPALLLPLHYQPAVAKEFRLGIIPHINDYKLVKELFKDSPDIKVIDFLTHDIEKTTDEIYSCENILSSSLHGVVTAHAYNIPAVQVRFSDRIYGDGVKYHDYFLSVNLNIYEPCFIDKIWTVDQAVMYISEHSSTLPLIETVIAIQQNLMQVCPFHTEKSNE